MDAAPDQGGQLTMIKKIKEDGQPVAISGCPP